MDNHLKALTAYFLLTFVFASGISSQNLDWSPADNPLMTKWAGEINPGNPLPEYPRPQMVREEWKSLNGMWEYAIVAVSEEYPSEWEGNILVPFGVESSLSGVKKRVGPDNKLWYTTTFSVPEGWSDDRLLLHFGAVDWEAVVWVNGKKVGSHYGGYTAFSFDITHALKSSSEQKITVAVWDPTDDGFQPRGKQVRNPQSIWYTPTTGIWQSVWIEPVPEVSIADLKITPKVSEEKVEVILKGVKESSIYSVEVVVKDQNVEVGNAVGVMNESVNVALKEVKLWSPKNPFLYDLTIYLKKDGEVVDRVESYFGMREVHVGKAEDGYMRLFLNGEPLFHYGLLDQGFWPDGIYTAPTDEALKYDIEVTKSLGFNMIRKHVKVEPARWYYWADKIGILVWQDMPNGDRHIAPGEDDVIRTAQSAYNYKSEFEELISQFYNYPSIVSWVPFNEGWGQFQTAEITRLTKELDSTRIINTVSGWQDRNVGDVHDIHSYPGPDMPDTEENRAAILGEFGGEALVVEDNLWIRDFSEAPSHYETSNSEEELHATYKKLLENLITLKKKGLAGAVYTQTTDVESEVNGIMTYDRKVIKFNSNFLKEIHQRVIEE